MRPHRPLRAQAGRRAGRRRCRRWTLSPATTLADREPRSAETWDRPCAPELRPAQGRKGGLRRAQDTTDTEDRSGKWQCAWGDGL